MAPGDANETGIVLPACCDGTEEVGDPMVVRRRDLLIHAAAVAGLGLFAGRLEATPAPRIVETSVDVRTAEGLCQTFVARPRGRGPFPVVIIYFDASGVREELRDMARHFAAQGYYAILPNFYYRSGVLEIGPEDMDRNSPFWDRTRAALSLVSLTKIMADTDSIVAFLETQRQADASRIGIMGFCVSGPWVVHAAARHPARILVAASIHGVYLVTPAPDSAHRVAPTVPADLYFAFAANDDFVPQTEIDALRTGLGTKPNAEIEIYPGVRHGFAFPLRYAYDRPSAERLFTKLGAVFGSRLSGRRARNSRARG